MDRKYPNCNMRKGFALKVYVFFVDVCEYASFSPDQFQGRVPGDI